MRTVSVSSSPGIGLAISVTPENGMILVFGDAGTHNPSSWRTHYAASQAKKQKIFWIYTPCCWGHCENSFEAYRGLSEGRIHNTMSELNINQFFTDAVLTVGFILQDKAFVSTSDAIREYGDGNASAPYHLTKIVHFIQLIHL